MEALRKLYHVVDTTKTDLLRDIGLLTLRLSMGLTMAFAHGFGKMGRLFGDEPIQFGDPIGLGPAVSLFLAASAEVVAALLVAVGLATRLAAFPVVFTMVVAFFLVHGADPFQKKELAFVYLFGFTAIMLTGPGRFSLDHKLKG